MLDFPWEYRFWKDHLTVILNSFVTWPQQAESQNEDAVPPVSWEACTSEGLVEKQEERPSWDLDTGPTDLPREREDPVIGTTDPVNGPEEETVPVLRFPDCANACGGVEAVDTEEQRRLLKADKKREKQRLRRQKQRQERRDKRQQEAEAGEAEVLHST